MRSLVVWLALSLGLAGVLGAQSLSEYGAAAAGGVTGGAAGKKVSDGITAIFGKVDKQTADAAKQTKPAAAKAPATAEAAPSAAPSTASAAPAPAAGNVPSPPKPAAKTLRKRAAGADQNVAKSTAKGAGKDDAYNLVPPPPPLPIQRVAIGRPVETSARLVSPTPAPAAASAPPIAPPPPPPPVTIEDLRGLAPGTHREDVLKLGTFASRITMIDNGHLAETFRYPVGSVRVSDGVVAAVELQ
jgi:hypothetical protein